MEASCPPAPVAFPPFIDGTARYLSPGRIFNPFTQAERSLVRQHEGVGLGLPIVRRFAELHGGGVEIDSAPERGTAVTILLPKERLLEG